MSRINGRGPHPSKSRRKRRPHPNTDARLCMYDSETIADKLWLSCHRKALPGRLLCHKHAGIVAKQRAWRARKAAA